MAVSKKIARVLSYPLSAQNDPVQTRFNKPCKNGHSQKDQKLVFKANYRLMQVKSIAECAKGHILQYFRPSFSYHLP